MSDRIRVLFAIGSLAGGGSERQIVNILRHIDRSKFEPHLYLVNRTGEFLSQVPDDVEIASFVEPANAGALNLPGLAHRAQVTHVENCLREKQIDVLYDRTPHMTLISAPACRRTNTPRLSTIVCDPEHDLRESFTRFRWIKERLLRKAYRTADCVIANSQSLSEASQSGFGLSRTQVVTISNGFDFEEISRLSEASEDALTLKQTEATYHLVAVGRLHPQKGLVDLINAVHELNQRRVERRVELSLIGQGPERESLMQRVDELDLGQQVRFTGFLSNPYRAIRTADLFCLTSLYEGMPNVLVEAMSLGVPVLSTDCPHGPRDILQGGELGTLVPCRDSKKIADGIEQAIASASNRDIQTAKAKESVLSRFSIGPTTRSLEELLTYVARHHK